MTTRVRAFKSITVRGLLSFAPDAEPFELDKLNLLIGPNGAGKSNFIEAFSVLRAIPGDLDAVFRRGRAAGIHDWPWRGRDDDGWPTMEISVDVSTGYVGNRPNRLTYGIGIDAAEGAVPHVSYESLHNADPRKGERVPLAMLIYEPKRVVLTGAGGQSRSIDRDNLDSRQSVLSQFKDPDQWKDLGYLAHLLSSIRIYRSWTFGPGAAVRMPSSLEARSDHLEETYENLGARVDELMLQPIVKRRLLNALRDLAPGFDDLAVATLNGRREIRLTEGNRSIPAWRLSDGTLRYLSLLTVLLDPQPPPLIILDEPDLGLHPDVLPTLRDLLLQAAEKCQLIVTTHSPALLDAFTEHAEHVVVCEQPATGTTLRRLEQRDLVQAKDRGGLGLWWMSGGIGGVRW